MIRKTLAALAIVTGGAAQAATYDWSYSFDTGTPQVLAGVIEGAPAEFSATLIQISSIHDVTLNGVAFGGPLTAVNNAHWWYGGIGTPTVTLDGTEMNFCAASVGICEEDGFLFSAGGTTRDFALFPAEARTVNYPGFGPFDTYDEAGWSMTLRAAAVPVPAGMGLLLVALSGLACVARRRSA